MSLIKQVFAREVLDSRGNPTVEAEVLTTDGVRASAIVPSGASTGSHEAIELRDGDNTRYLGRGVLRAVGNVHTRISPAVFGMPVSDQNAIDAAMINLDGSADKSQLGANAILAVSMATARAAAIEAGIPLYAYLGNTDTYVMPVPMINIINGGAHADNKLDVQEFMVLPIGADSIREAVQCGVEIFHALKLVLRKRGLSIAVGDEGGFAPDLPSNEAALEAILEAISQAGYQAGKNVMLGLDVASTEFYRDGSYVLESQNRSLDSNELMTLLVAWCDQYPIITIEDGMAEDDWQGWECLTNALGKRVQLVGDDLFVTNTKLLQRGIQEQIANSILIKMNQIGTLSETLAAIKMAKVASYTAVVSHRSGETEDTTIADLAVATACGQIKTGSMSRSERTAKYNRLLKIEDELAEHSHYAGNSAFSRFTLT